MIYYMELDKDKEYLEIHEVKNIHNLSLIMKASWGDIKYFLEEYECDILPCGKSIPFIKKGGKMWFISDSREYLQINNTRYMSKEVYDDLMFRNQFGPVYATSKIIAMKKGNEVRD